MIDLLAPTLAAEAVSAFVAVALARRRSDHKPVAVAFVCMLLAHLARLVLVRKLGPASVDPYRGAKLVLVYLDGALVLASLAIVPALALAVAIERPRRAVAAVVGVWLVASIALGVAYPSPLVRGPGLARVYLAGDLAGLAVAIAAIGSWARRRKPVSPALAVANDGAENE